MTEIVFRNFISLLCLGAFKQEVLLEEMSTFKWHQLLLLASSYNVQDIISLEIIKAAKKTSFIIPEDIIKEAQEIALPYEEPLFQERSYDDFLKGVPRKFSNYFINRRMGRILKAEIQGIDLSMPSLIFIDKLFDSINEFLISGPNFRSIIDVGVYLRANSNKIDFIKVQRWIRDLGMSRMASVTGSYLIDLFGFSSEELPYIEKIDKGLFKKTYKSLKKSKNNFKIDDTREIDSVRIRALIGTINRPSTQVFRYFLCCPLEASSRFLSNISMSLSNIEE